MRLLVVEDAAALARSIAQGLEEEGFSVDIVGNGEDALHLATEIAYAAIVLDRMLPQLDGMSVLRRLRERGRDTPVLMLTALGQVGDRVEGLDAGADDYLVKPFSFDELLARLRVLIRRRHGHSSNAIVFGPMRIDPSARTVEVHGRALELTAREFSLLELLALQPGHTFSRSAIVEAVYNEDAELESNVIDVFVARLRRKLDAAGLAGAQVVKTMRGAGYRFDPPEER